MKRFAIAAFMMFLAAGPGFAQSDTVQDHIDYYASVEEHLLEIQSEYLERERGFAEPIWVRTKQGSVQIIDGARLRTRLEGLVFVLQSIGLEAAALESLSPMMRIAAELAGEEGRSDIAVSRVMDALTARSTAVRGEATGDLNALLVQVRSESASLRASQTPVAPVRSVDENYVFEKANYWNNGYKVIRDFTDAQACARICAEDAACKVASYSDHTARNGWANTCTLRDDVGERHTEQRGISSWVKPHDTDAVGGKLCMNGGMIAGVGGDDVYREAPFDGERRVTTVDYRLDIAPDPKHNGATFQHFFLDGEPFPDANWGVNIGTAQIVCN